ncbi:hypothetical protein ACFLSP_03480, partial [Bacteroidota bacterium]
VDSTGFGVFLSIMKTANNNYGFFKICNINAEVMELSSSSNYIMFSRFTVPWKIVLRAFSNLPDAQIRAASVHEAFNI